MTLGELVKEHWQVFIGLIGLVTWLVRLEAGMKATASEIIKLWSARARDKLDADQIRQENNTLLHEINNDVKGLIGQVGELKGKVK